MRRIETIATVICLLFAIAISLYHVSSEGYLGLSEKDWYYVWIVSENGLLLTMSFLITLYSWGVLRLLFTWVFIPYFVLKLIYHFICISGLYIMSPKLWESVWSGVLVLIIIISLVLTLTKIRHA